MEHIKKGAQLCTILSVLAMAAMAVFISNSAHAQDTPEAAAEQAEAATPDASTQEEPPAFPVELSDPDISMEILQLSLIPLTADELGALAATWQDHARAATQAVIDKSIEIRSADPAASEPLRLERLALLEDRGVVFEKFSAVVTGFEAKGGNPEMVAAFRNYINAITVQETYRWTWREFADTALDWFFSLDGGGQLALSLAIVVASFLGLLVVARMVRGWTRRMLERIPSISMLLRSFLVMAVYWVTIAFGLMIVLALLGVNITPLFALVGGASFIIAFALQDTLGNLAAGLMIMINHPFDEGDFVSVGGVAGTVKSVSIVSTTVTTPDNRMIVIPNSKVWGDVITNNSASETRRVDMVFGIGYNDPIDKAQAIMEEIVANHPAVLSDPAPLIRVNQLSASSVDFICRPWVRSDDYLTAQLDITQAVKEAFDANGISIPYPQTDMHVHFADEIALAKGRALLAAGGCDATEAS
jgi:small conductance mechanosensitive channel